MYSAMFGVNASGPNGSQPFAFNASGNNMSSTNTSTLHDIPALYSVPLMLHLVLGMAVMCNIFLYFLPLSSTLQALREQGHLKEMRLSTRLAPIYLMFAQSYLWAIYGHCVGLSDLAQFNGLGAIACVMHLAIVARAPQARDLVRPCILLSIVAVLFFPVCVMMSSSSTLARNRAFGYWATIFNLGMILAPLRAAAKVMHSGLLGSFPVFTVMASFMSSLLWAHYGFLVHDQIVLVPSMVGVGLCAGALLLVYASIWGRNGQSSAQSLLFEVESQPLMPRAHKKAGMSSCSSFFQSLLHGPQVLKPGAQRPGGYTAPRKDGELGAADRINPPNVKKMLHARVEEVAKMWEKAPFGSASSENASPTPMIERSTFSVVSQPAGTKSPFSAFGRAQSAEDADSGEEQEFPSKDVTCVDGETYRPCGAAVLGSGFLAGRGIRNSGGRGGIDCIL